MAIIAATLDRIKTDPLACLGGADHVNQLFAEAGHRWRKCIWDPATTFGVFVLQVLHQNTAIAGLRHLTDLVVKSSTYCEARCGCRQRRWRRSSKACVAIVADACKRRSRGWAIVYL